MILLLLAAVALLCTAVGQLAAISERLERRPDKAADQPAPAPDSTSRAETSR